MTKDFTNLIRTVKKVQHKLAGPSDSSAQNHQDFLQEIYVDLHLCIAHYFEKCSFEDFVSAGKVANLVLSRTQSD